MLRTQRVLRDTLDRAPDPTDDIDFEAAYLDERLTDQGVSLDGTDILTLAAAYEADATLVTHDSAEKTPVCGFADIDVASA